MVNNTVGFLYPASLEGGESDLPGAANGVGLYCRQTLGSLRLQLRLRDETVLPSSRYRPLVELLCQSVGTNLNVSCEGRGSTHPEDTSYLSLQLFSTIHLNKTVAV